ncbi:unnamed protein product, partial [marine sediment metagenome]
MIAYAFSFVFPYLLVLAVALAAAARLGVDLRSARRRIALSAASLVIVLVPPWWIPVARWIVGVNANFSIPLTAILFAHVWRKLTGAELLDERERLTAWVFGLAAGVALYPMALGLGRFDPYGLGWELSWAFVIFLAATVAFLYRRNRFGIVLVAAILAYDLGLLESPNLWDYFVDPFYALAAAGTLA